MSSILHQPFVFVDLETTGGSHFYSRILEIGVVRVENNAVTATYQTLVAPGESIPAFITNLTGITDDDVISAPSFANVADELAEILDGAVFVAHNVRFDYAFLKMEFDRLGVNFQPSLLCTVRLSRRLFPQFRSHKLASLIERHKLVAPARHRAFDDAQVLWQFYQLCQAEFDLDTLEEALKVQLQSQALPSQLDAAQVAALPDGPGVYIFEDDDGAPLYVGKSVTVRRRVMSHFANDYGRGSELKLAQAVKHLRAIPTHGGLSALLLESDMIKDLQPRYNRLLRQRELMTLVLRRSTHEGYQSIELADARHIDPQDAQRLLAVYATEGTAKRSLQALVSNYRLCPKLLGLEHTVRACFLTQLGKCDRACEGLESTSDYNARFEAAFERGRVVAWPYGGPVLIREQHPDVPGSVGFVVDGWCLLAHLRELEDGTVEARPELRRFDLDRYKIIRAFLQDARNRRQVTVLTADQAAQLMRQVNETAGAY